MENLPLESKKIAEETYDILDNDLSMKIKLENVKLTNMLNIAKKENSKLPQIKELVEEYKTALKSKDEEIADLKAKNEELYASIEKTPKFIRKLFFKDFEKGLLK